jgi:hypothetical protein
LSGQSDTDDNPMTDPIADPMQAGLDTLKKMKQPPATPPTPPTLATRTTVQSAHP